MIEMDGERESKGTLCCQQDIMMMMMMIYIYIYIYIGSSHSVRVIVVENGYGNPSSNPGQSCLHFTLW